MSSLKRPATDDSRRETSNHNSKVRFAPDTTATAVRKKRPRIDRSNEFEEDDVDDWEPDEQDQEEEEPVGGVSSKELLHAKRSRRLKRDGKEADAATNNDKDNNEDGEETGDATTSLIADQKNPDDVPIEPFNLNQERSDGSGYFIGDTYVFRKRDIEEEPDAWLEALDQTKDFPQKLKELPSDEDDNDDDNDDKADSMTSREELYVKLLPLMSGNETILQALVRYGNLLKRQKPQQQQNSTAASVAKEMAQGALDSLTKVSSALLLKGDVDIYQKTRNDLSKEVARIAIKNKIKGTKGEEVQWEYKGNQDGKIHGLYTTEQIKSWIQAGYFIGPQAVQVRTVTAVGGEKEAESKPLVDDLLSDLMDDDDDEEEGKEDHENGGGETAKSSAQSRGEWASSNDIDFSSFS